MRPRRSARPGPGGSRRDRRRSGPCRRSPPAWRSPPAARSSAVRTRSRATAALRLRSSRPATMNPTAIGTINGRMLGPPSCGSEYAWQTRLTANSAMARTTGRNRAHGSRPRRRRRTPPATPLRSAPCGQTTPSSKRPRPPVRRRSTGDAWPANWGGHQQNGQGGADAPWFVESVSPVIDITPSALSRNAQAMSATPTSCNRTRAPSTASSILGSHAPNPGPYFVL